MFFDMYERIGFTARTEPSPISKQVLISWSPAHRTRGYTPGTQLNIIMPCTDLESNAQTDDGDGRRDGRCWDGRILSISVLREVATDDANTPHTRDTRELSQQKAPQDATRGQTSNGGAALTACGPSATLTKRRPPRFPPRSARC